MSFIRDIVKLFFLLKIDFFYILFCEQYQEIKTRFKKLHLTVTYKRYKTKRFACMSEKLLVFYEIIFSSIFTEKKK